MDGVEVWIFFHWHCASRQKSDSSVILLLPYLNPLVHCVPSQNKPLFPQNAVYHVRVLSSWTTERKGSWLLKFLAGWKKKLFAGGRMDKEVFERRREDERAWTASGASDPGRPADI